MMQVAANANRYIEATAPWKLAKQEAHAELDGVLVNLARTIVRLAILAHPFMPLKAQPSGTRSVRGSPSHPPPAGSRARSGRPDRAYPAHSLPQAGRMSA